MVNSLSRIWIEAGGSLPNGWSIVELQSLLLTEKSISVGVMYPGSHDEFGVPLIKVGDVSNGQILHFPESKITNVIDEEYKRTRLTGDELLITLVGNPGDCVIAEPYMKGWNVARALAVLKLKDPAIRQWLRIILLSRPAKHIIDSRLNTTVQRTLNLKDIKEIPVPMPPIRVREKIAGLSNAFESKITLNRQINQTLEQMAQTLFKSWFVDFDPVIDNALDAGNDIPDTLQDRAEQRRLLRAKADFKPLPIETRALFPSEFEDTELGWVPKGWAITRLENILELAYGKALKKTDRIAGKFPVYGSGGIDGTHNESLVKGPGIIVGRKGTVGSLHWESDDFYPIDTVFYVKPKQGYSLNFCFQLLKTLKLENMNTDAAVPGLNRNNAYRLECIAPNNTILEFFSETIGKYQTRISFCLSEINSLVQLRDRLIPKLISGELALDALPELPELAEAR